jgi:hypothetical protein
VKRMLVAALATSLIAAAGAEEPARTAPGPAPAEAAGKPAAAAKSKKKKDGQVRRTKAPPKAEAKPEQQKPCEPVRPCPVE